MSCFLGGFFLVVWPRILHFLKAEILDNVLLWSKDSTLRVKGENGMGFPPRFMTQRELKRLPRF